MGTTGSAEELMMSLTCQATGNQFIYHSLSTSEIESALILHPLCAEAAVIGVDDEITGQQIVCFVTLKSSKSPSHDCSAILGDLKNKVRSEIGPFATPKRILIVPDLPKTRSGKIMRRILRKISAGDVTGKDITTDGSKLVEKLGDLSTLADPSVIPVIIAIFEKK